MNIQQTTYTYTLAWDGDRNYLYLDHDYNAGADGHHLGNLYLCKKTGKVLQSSYIKQIEDKAG